MKKSIKYGKGGLLAITAFLAVFVLSGCNKKSEEAKSQTNNITNEGQSKLEENTNEIQSKIDEQQAKINELQNFKDEQEQANTEASAQEQQNKKVDCESRLKKQQEALASTQRELGEYQKVYNGVKSNKCPKTRLCETICYDDCLENNGCNSSSCSSDTKSECKKSHEDNLKMIKQEMNDGSESVKKNEANLQSIKNECSQYFN